LRLVVALPESDTEAFLTAIGLARRAPVFETLGTGAERSYRATFPDVIQSLDVAIRLVGEASQCPGARVTIEDREVASLSRFWSALLCYRESLAEPNPPDHCLRFSARLTQFAGCPDQACQSPCQFLCTRCVSLAQDRSGPSILEQLKELAREAEVAWCPNLRLRGSPARARSEA
jgi:hypothetical protein